MEGITGIDDSGDCLPSHPAAYARGRRLMTDEVLVVSEALRKGGVDQISVGDCHMVGTNIERERMPDGIEVRPIADLALVEAEPSFTKAHGGGNLDAVVLLGHHAGTPNPRAFCSHTFIWEMEVLLDGVSLSETRARSAIGRTSIPSGIRSRSMLVPTMCQSPTEICSTPPLRSASITTRTWSVISLGPRASAAGCAGRQPAL